MYSPSYPLYELIPMWFFTDLEFDGYCLDNMMLLDSGIDDFLDVVVFHD